MSRRRGEQSGGVQLFPFLDVLLSAMGALILLLAVASRNLSKQEQELITEAPSAEELQVRREMVDWEIEQLAKQRDKTAGDLENQRLQLGHLEQHSRQLRKELEELVRAQEQLSQTPDDVDREQRDAELRELRSRLTAARHELDAALRDQEGAEATYAVVPYQGPNETRRRPIYIECRAEEIVLQPEGVVLTAKDFDGPLGPGNPLAAAVRAAREHLSRLRRSSAGDSGEPYPLLLVRPEGIETFYAARAALDSWGSEFGYEFIEADWKINYQASDAALASVEQEAVDIAREQMRLVAQFAPRVNRNMTARTYRASKSGGGVVAEDAGEPPSRRGFGNGGGPQGGFSSDRRGRGGDEDGWADSGRGGRGRSPTLGGRSGSAYGEGSGGYGSGGERYANGGGYGSGFDGAGGSATTDHYRSALEAAQARRNQQGLYDGTVSSAAGGENNSGSGIGPLGAPATAAAIAASDRAGNSNGNGAGTGGAGNSPQDAEEIPAGASGQFGANGAYSANAANASNGQGGSAADGSSQLTGGPTFPASGNGSAGRAGEGGGATGQQPPGIVGMPGSGPSGVGQPMTAPPGQGMPQLGANFGEGSQPSQQDPNAMQSRQRGQPSGGPQSPFDTAGKPKGNYRSSPSGRSGGPMYAKRRDHSQQNWALPESGQSSVPLARPIRVECRQDRLVVHAERGSTALTRVIELGDRTEESVDEFVSVIWDHMETWGIAGDGFYWHPIIKLETVGNGDERAAELKTLLANSGLEVRDPVRPTDSVRRAMSHNRR